MRVAQLTLSTKANRVSGTLPYGTVGPAHVGSQLFWCCLWWPLVRDNWSVAWHCRRILHHLWGWLSPLQVNLLGNENRKCADAMRWQESHRSKGNGKVMCWFEQGRWQLIKQRSKGCSLHIGILFLHWWSLLGVKDKIILQMELQKDFPAKALQRVKRTVTSISLTSKLWTKT